MPERGRKVRMSFPSWACDVHASGKYIQWGKGMQNNGWGESGGIEIVSRLPAVQYTGM